MPGPSNVNYDESGSTPIGLLDYTDVVTATAGVKTELFHQTGYPWSFTKLAHQTTTVSRVYPYDGDGVIDAYSAGTPSITLDATGVDANLEGVGLLVMLTSGAGIGEIRRIVSYVSASRVATLNAAYTSAPSAGHSYTLLVDLWKLNQLHVKLELNASTATLSCAFRPMLYDRGRNAQDAGLRIPRCTVLPTVEVGHSNTNTAVTEGGYYHMNAYTIVSRGAVGAKILMESCSSTAFSLWASGS